MKTINTVFAVHNHQPLGNFDSVFEEAYRHSYKPLLDVIGRHPSIKLTQHWTGPLLEWIIKHHPELIEKMKDMVQRGQLELLTGAYYEAILAIIPAQDCIGQIRKLSDFIGKTFDYEPRGMWLAERVWEQPLVGSLVKAGVEFVVVDDTHFRHAGLQDEELLGYYVTEEQGVILKVIPIDRELRYTIPFRPVEETVRYLQKIASEDGRRVVVNADDGEKFGVWPKTFKTVYEEGWLESFCRMMEEHRSWISTMHMGSLIDHVEPQGRIYLPTASYSEMMQWALNPTAFLHLERFEKELKNAGMYDGNAMFVRGGYWRNFLVRYPEANHMHKKMLRIARRARSLAEKKKVGSDIFDHIWAGQCNDPYWHGVFGGVYLPNLRFPVYRSLLQAESKLDAMEDLPKVRIDESDFDCDGHPEILIETDEMNLYFTPASGGSLVELDFKPVHFNLLDIMSRKEEGYHRRLLFNKGEYTNTANTIDGVLMKEEGLEQNLHFDWYRHGSMIDHFFGPATTLESFTQSRYLELGDFVNQPYASEIRKTSSYAELVLTRNGALWRDNRPHRLTVEKVLVYKPGTGSFAVDYSVKNLEQHPVDIWFGVEFNVGLMAGDAHDRYYEIDGRSLIDKRLRSAAEEQKVTGWKLVDEWLGVEVQFSVKQQATLWRSPIETVSLSEGGFERLYQSSMVVSHWRAKLEQEFNVRIIQTVRKL